MGADPGFAFGHDGEENPDDVDALCIARKVRMTKLFCRNGLVALNARRVDLLISRHGIKSALFLTGAGIGRIQKQELTHANLLECFICPFRRLSTPFPAQTRAPATRAIKMGRLNSLYTRDTLLFVTS